MPSGCLRLGFRSKTETVSLHGLNVSSLKLTHGGNQVCPSCTECESGWGRKEWLSRGMLKFKVAFEGRAGFNIDYYFTWQN
jgi:hypothetical protein